jgi:Tol biopolymer transport system component
MLASKFWSTLAIASLTLVLVPAASAAPAPHSGLIVFGSDATGSYQLYTVRGDGTGLTQITDLPDAEAVHPDWSPDGRHIVFEMDTPQTSRLAVIDADGSHLRVLPKLAPRGGGNGQPSYAPTGRRIYYERYDGADEAAIFSASLAGNHRRRVTDPPAGQYDTDPNVSPDGLTLSFIRQAGGEFDSALMTMDLTSGEVTQLTPFSADVAVKQAWSPNGRRLTYSRDAWELRDGVSANVMSVRADGARGHSVTVYSGGATNAFVGSYSPDGRWIVYREEHADRAPLMVIRPDGSDAHAILEVDGMRPRFIDWGPGSS